MGRVFRKKRRAELPDDAEIIKGGRVAKWTDGNGRKRSAPLSPDGDALLIEDGVYAMRYADAQGRTVERSTGCRERDNALAVLREAETRVEKIMAGVLTVEDADARDWARAPLADHVDDYLASLARRGVTAKTIVERRRYLVRVIDSCGWRRLADIARPRFERMLTDLAQDDLRDDAVIKRGAGARTLNAYRAAWVAFVNWAIREGRWAGVNPFVAVTPSNERTGRRHERRAFTPDELLALFSAAEARPLHEFLTGNRGAVKGMRESTKRKLERRGIERALMYRVLYMTGLRVGELRRVTMTSVYWLDERPRIELPAHSEKARRGAVLPLRADLAAALAEYLGGRLEHEQRAAQAAGRPIPVRLDMSAPLFPSMPEKLNKVLDRDLAFAGIPKVDERGRVACAHSFRYSLASHLNAAGVAPRVAQAALRHATMQMTMGTYTDLAALDVSGALDRLPGLHAPTDAAKAASASPEHPRFRPPFRPLSTGKTSQNAAIVGSEPSTQHRAKRQDADTAVGPCLQGVAQHGNKGQEVKEWSGRQDLNLRPPAPKAGGPDSQAVDNKAVTESGPDSVPCFAPHDPTVLALAERLAAIPPEHRAALIALLGGDDDAKGNG